MSVKIHKNFFDIVILPDKTVRDYSIGLSQQLKKYGSILTLGKKRFLPHVSLFHFPVTPKKFDDFIKNLENTVKDSKCGRLKLEGIKVFKSHSSFLLATDKPQWLETLYLKIIKNSLEYFDFNYGTDKLWGIDGLPKIMQNNIKKYGTPLVGKWFIPHITLGVFKDKKDAVNAFSRLKVKKHSFEVKNIYVCQLGKHFSCQKIIKKIEF